MYVLCQNTVHLYGRPTHIVSVIKQKKCSVSSQSELLDCGLFLTLIVQLYKNLQTLEYRRIFCDLVLCYKILHNKIDTDLSNVFKLNSNSMTRGHTLELCKSQCSLNYTKYYFTNRVVTFWNKLPPNVVSATEVSTFKTRLASVNLVY